eukprot:15065732-Alexandrium_andersonii.AAC.1
MSASLVGSEMCIRDRPGDHAPLAGFGRPLSVLQARLWHGCRAPPPSRGACLLYTSDAADDM